MKRLVAAAVVTAAAAALSLAGSSAASASPSLCLHGSVTVNGTNQTVDQCVPPAS